MTDLKSCTELLRFETMLKLAGEIPMSTITFYKGCVEDAAIYMKERVQAVVEANLWLCGRVATWKLHYGAAYDPTQFCYDPTFRIPREAPIRDLARLCKPFLVSGEGRAHAPFRVSIVQTYRPGTFTLTSRSWSSWQSISARSQLSFSTTRILDPIDNACLCKAS